MAILDLAFLLYGFLDKSRGYSIFSGTPIVIRLQAYRSWRLLFQGILRVRILLVFL